MSEIREVVLPGVGVRYEFETNEGKSIDVVSHRIGLREICVWGRLADPVNEAVVRRIEGGAMQGDLV